MGHSARLGYQLSCESDRPATFSPVQPFLSANGISPLFPSRPCGGSRSLGAFVIAALLAFVLAPGAAAAQSAVAPVTQAGGAPGPAGRKAHAGAAPAGGAPAA